MKDLMIDIETLGHTSETPVISIGAVFFDIEKKILGPTFYMALDVNEQIERGRKPSGSTLQWWLQQSDAAKRVFHEKAQPAPQVLQLFVNWYKTGGNMALGHALPEKQRAYIWGNGSTFDISIMEHILRDYKIELPWGYNKAMDLRTFKRFVAKGQQVVKQGVDHNALDDAVSQANYVLENS